ncbi:hypothetical protein [Nostoc sp. S13]|uniref:hypothetical protein n=1 Tax=Nostoc sp. S13 TaxID=3019266 RepID=UPI00263618A4|nr:hypothetical protein [Nostoc sp. S13]MDF5740032.1 hypothetical protein [Nostoc sp. S13]
MGIGQKIWNWQEKHLKMNIDSLERAIAFLLWGGIALLVKGVIVFWEVGQKAIAVKHKLN